MESFWKRFGNLFHQGQADATLLYGRRQRSHNRKGMHPRKVNLSGTRVHHSYCGRHIGKKF